MFGISKQRKKYKAPPTSTTFVSGSSDYIVVSNHADLQVTDSVSAKDFSISFWVKLTVDASGTSNKDGYVGMKAGAFRGHGFYMRYNDASGDNESIELRCNTGSASHAVSTDTDLDHNVWYHIAATYDVSTTTGKIYVDGALSATNTSQNVPTQYTGDVHIGSSNTDSDFVSSVTGDVAFWKGSILSDTDVNLLYEGIRGPLDVLTGDLKGWWKLDSLSETGSNKVLDDSGSSHHGTSSGLADADFDTADSPTGI